MNSPAPSCALCDRTIDGATTAHAVHGKLVCEACRRLVLACEPRQVLPYADREVRRRRRWLLPAAVAAVVVVLAFALLLAARTAAVQRARAEEMRALAAERQARAAAVQQWLSATQPAK